MKAIKITQPAWLMTIGPQIADFQRLMDVPRITFPSMMEYFRSAVQFGGERDEFWVVFEDDTPVAFGHWFVYMGLHVGTIHCDFLYKWSKSEKPTGLLIDEFIQFGQKHRSNHLTATFIKESTFKLFQKQLARRGYDLKHDPWVGGSAFQIKKETEDG